MPVGIDALQGGVLGPEFLDMDKKTILHVLQEILEGMPKKPNTPTAVKMIVKIILILASCPSVEKSVVYLAVRHPVRRMAFYRPLFFETSARSGVTICEIGVHNLDFLPTITGTLPI